MIAFGLWYWASTAVARSPAQAEPAAARLPVPADGEPELARARLDPRLIDYIYVSFTNSIAFSPTDAMPLTRQAKMLMLLESAPRR